LTHVPIRTCLACGRKTAKSNLLRICRDQDGQINIDPEQKLPGRGAYVCPTRACAEQLAQARGLHYGFRTNIPAEAYDNVIEFVKTHDN